MMKKILCIILICVLMFSLCGCLNITISKDSNTSSGSQQSSSGGSSSASQYTNMSGYTIICVSSDGNAPVEGVNLQFCSNSKCMVGTTNADGISNFDVPDGEYDVHIQSVPDGFDMPSEAEFKMTPDTKQKTVIIPGGDEESTSFDSASDSDDNSGSESIPSVNLSHSEVVPSANHGTITGDTVDIYGNPVNFQQLFGAADYTFLNIFSESCNPCMEEMPELTKLNKLLSQYGGQVVLMLHISEDFEVSKDFDDARDLIQSALNKVQNAGAEGMQIVLYTSGVSGVLDGNYEGWPSSFMIDNQGNVISDHDNCEQTAESYAQWVSQHLR